MMTSKEIRSSFLHFFEERGHKIVSSAPVIPHGDPTLLFTNAGMNQFKDVFLGAGSRDYKRAADTQKCIRVSGKHNDLEEVGYDTYHHTFFEMLGNWSFGDYYKQEAIAWSWELLNEVWKLPKDRLYATVYRTDDEAFEIWKKFLPEKQIQRFDEKDNFWEMGETGPCGPCTEIHFDRTIDKSGASLVNAGSQDVIEIWNNVFIQYNRRSDRTLEDLASKHVDTGMGFERVCAVIQETPSNYETDVFQPIISSLENLSGREYERKLTDTTGVAMRVISDHIRTLSFAIADGAIPGNEGRGYVLRRILRRASRYARNIDFKEPILYKLVAILVENMGSVFPELKQQQQVIERIIKAEEESFLQTLERGLERFQMIVQKEYHNPLTGIRGEDAFQLFDTYGFPLDLTQLLAKEYGFGVDVDGFNENMKIQKERSRAARKQTNQEVEIPVVELPPTEFQGYELLESTSTVQYVDGDKIALTNSPLYVESGGQVSDTGILTLGGENYSIIDVKKSAGVYFHVCDRAVESLVGTQALLKVDESRRWHIQRNHSATHLLHEALRVVLGNHVKQTGSLVNDQHLRFDFSHFEKVSDSELKDIEEIVNGKILERFPVETRILPIEEAQKIPNVKMFFGDKYGEKVRVVIMDEKFSAEFCGGTHVSNTSEIGIFKIKHESAIAAGMRRIEAVSGIGVQKYIDDLLLQQTKSTREVDNLGETISKLEKQLAKLQLDQISRVLPEFIARATVVNGVHVVSEIVEIQDSKLLYELGEKLRNQIGKHGIGLLCAVIDGKVQLVCVSTEDVMNRLPAGKVVGVVAKELGGGGGGKPSIATAGAKDLTRMKEVITNFPMIIQNW